MSKGKVAMVIGLALVFWILGTSHGKADKPKPITLVWDRNVNTGQVATDTVGYAVWLGFCPGAETTRIEVGDVTSYKVQLGGGATYYFVVRSYNAAGIESTYSNEVSINVP
jgi:hypothetical protein